MISSKSGRAKESRAEEKNNGGVCLGVKKSSKR